LSLSGAHLLGDRLITAFVSHSLEALALELGEPDAVGGVRHAEVEHRPDEREAAGLAGEAADHLGASLHLAERSLEQVGAPLQLISAFSGSVRSSFAPLGKSFETNGSAASRTCGIPTSSSPSPVCIRRGRKPLRSPR